MNQKHEFAFFTPEVAQISRKDKDYTIKDSDLIRRLTSIVRVQVGDKIILFDEQLHVDATILIVSKKAISIAVAERKNHTILQPTIVWLLPLLEREAFEDALTALTVMGAAEIIPVITQKSRKTWGNPKERDRAKRLMIAAAEQSKQFVLPLVQETVSLESALETIKKKDAAKLFFDAAGKPAFTVLEQIKKNKVQTLIALIGPEGDLTAAEKKLVQQNGFDFCRLTPTILRASTAVEVGMGLLRTCL